MPSKKPIKEHLLQRLYTALMIAPTLAILIMSAVYQFLVFQTGYSITDDIALMLGVLSLMAIAASTVLAAVYKRPTVNLLFFALFCLCFFCYLSFCLAGGNTDLLADQFFQSIMLAFSVPVWSYMSVASVLTRAPAVAALILTAVIFLSNGVLFFRELWLHRKGR